MFRANEKFDTAPGLQYTSVGPMVCHHTSQCRGISLVSRAPRQLFVKSIQGQPPQPLTLLAFSADPKPAPAYPHTSILPASYRRPFCWQPCEAGF